MKKIFESEFHNAFIYETVEKIHVYQIEDKIEFDMFDEMTHKERCDCFDVFDEGRYEVDPGARYRTYSFDYTSNHIIMYEHISMNV